MASLGPALQGVLAYEGGYKNDPADSGGETYRGISRRFHPDWIGWSVIDQSKSTGAPFPDTRLQPLVTEFYRVEFWDRLHGDDIPDQALANELLEQAVILGIIRTVGHLQRALNCVNDMGKRWPDVAAKGFFGPQTLTAVQAACRANLAPVIIKMLNAQQAVYFMERMEVRQENERFIGWFARV